MPGPSGLAVILTTITTWQVPFGHLQDLALQDYVKCSFNASIQQEINIDQFQPASHEHNGTIFRVTLKSIMVTFTSIMCVPLAAMKVNS